MGGKSRASRWHVRRKRDPRAPPPPSHRVSERVPRRGSGSTSAPPAPAGRGATGDARRPRGVLCVPDGRSTLGVVRRGVPTCPPPRRSARRHSASHLAARARARRTSCRLAATTSADTRLTSKSHATEVGLTTLPIESLRFNRGGPSCNSALTLRHGVASCHGRGRNFFYRVIVDPTGEGPSPDAPHDAPRSIREGAAAARGTETETPKPRSKP